MGLLVYLLLCRRVCVIINAHDFMAEHTLIRASGQRREDRRRTELNEQGVHSTATPDYRQYDINLNFFLEHFDMSKLRLASGQINFLEHFQE